MTTYYVEHISQHPFVRVFREGDSPFQVQTLPNDEWETFIYVSERLGLLRRLKLFPDSMRAPEQELIGETECDNCDEIISRALSQCTKCNSASPHYFEAYCDGIG